MRVVEMDPEKERSFRNLAEPRSRMFDHDLGAPFDSLVTIGAVAAHVKACVVDVEAAVKSRSGAVQWIENQRCHKGSGVISAMMQQVGQIRQLGGKWNAKIVHVIKLRIRSGKNRGVRSRSQRNMGVGAREHHPLLRHRIQIRRELPIRSEKPHAISASRIQGDQNDVGVFCRSLPNRTFGTLGGDR